MYIREFEDIHYISQILIIIETYQNEYKALAVNLLSKLVESEKTVNIIKKCFGFTIILNALNSANEYNIRISILHLIKVLLVNEDYVKELRAIGLINLLLLIFRFSL
jgi:radical SAM superfamily enzyme